ncbi:ParB N-terminal domain-containing protein [Actibacterium sp. 188UL27-1]|uniref:ParB/RepB/Spo0J family partition protein n=1 Tax=Actibacterium sp. 188UL27-1 TaxID=2786961 RepID=UPI00195D1098|nr:ParB N-terminal domain-containing protein [Actibacterium sp. 188UL27-1]MBM7070014.1 ParB N-terminal domain-containing protein [Actibacterium sp. 188UL27-1]
MTSDLSDLSPPVPTIQRIALQRIDTTKLIRDRAAGADPELDELMSSIQAVGLSNPIQIERKAGGYELIQGFRRWQAMMDLYIETEDPAFATIPAIVIEPGQPLETLYRRMVDENLTRKDISFGEMADLALDYVAATGAPAEAVDMAVDRLFASASRQKRSYIKHFAYMLDQLDRMPLHTAMIPRALGLDIAQALRDQPGFRDTAIQALRQKPDRTARQEDALLRHALRHGTVPAGTTGRAGSGKVCFDLPLKAGQARCTATAGKVELRLDHDFSRLDRRHLESATTAFFNALRGALGEDAAAP